MLWKGHAMPHHGKGLFGIRLQDRSRAHSTMQKVTLNIDQQCGRFFAQTLSGLRRLLHKGPKLRRVYIQLPMGNAVRP